MPRYRVNVCPDLEKSSSPLINSIWLYLGIITLGLLVVASQAKGAGLLPQAPMSVEAQANVVSAQPMARGTYGLGLQGDQRRNVAISASDEGSAVIDKTESLHLMLSAGVLDWLDLHLVAIGSKEGTHDHGSNSGFTGVGMMSKLAVAQQGRLTLALAPFVNVPGTRNDSFIYVAAPKTTFGWLALADFGEKGFAEVNLNWGYKYRDTEQWGDSKVRSEMLYRAAVSVWLTRGWTVFAGVDGRTVQMADVVDEGDRMAGFEGVRMGENFAGIEWSRSNVKLSGFFGKDLGGGRLDQGSQIVGFKIGYQFGEPDRKLSKQYYRTLTASDGQTDEAKVGAKEEETEEDELDLWMKDLRKLEDEKKKASAKAQRKLKEQSPDSKKDYEELSQVPHDFFGSYEEAIKEVAGEQHKATDWYEVRKQREREESDPSFKKPSADMIAEQELQKIRQQAELQRQTEEQQRLTDLEEERRMQRKLLEEEQKLLERYRRETRRELDLLPVITEDEVMWDGLN